MYSIAPKMPSDTTLGDNTDSF